MPLHPGQPQIEHHALAVGAYAQRDQHRYPHTLFSDPHPRIPPVEKEVTDPQLPEVPLRPRREVFPQPSYQARHRLSSEARRNADLPDEKPQNMIGVQCST